MARGGMDEEEKPVGELFGRLVDEGKAYAKAEYGLAKANAEVKAEQYKWPAALLFGALLFAQAAVTVLVVTVALSLATLVGPLAGGLLAVLFASGGAYLLYRLALARLKERP
jgi:hypothetical protein